NIIGTINGVEINETKVAQWDAVVNDINEVEISIGNLESKLDNYFEDYCLTFTEAKNIQNNIDQLIKESEDILRIARLPAYNLTQDSDVYDFSAKDFRYKLKLDEL